MKMTIGKKLFVGFAGVILPLIVVVIISFFGMRSVNQTYSNLLDVQVSQIVMTKELDIAVKKEQGALRSFLIIGDESSLKNFDDSRSYYLEVSEKLRKMTDDETTLKMLGELNEIENKYNALFQIMVPLKQQDKTEEYISLVKTDGYDVLAQFENKVKELSKYQTDQLDKKNEETTAEVSTMINIVIIIGLVAILIGLIIALLIGRMISKPIITIARSAEQISAGDLTIEEIKVRNKDELGDLAKSFNHMARSLREMIQSVGLTSEQVAASAEQLMASSEQSNIASKQIANTTQEAAMNLEQQVRSTVETAKTIDEMSNGIQQIADNAQMVSTTAVEASEKASEGGKSIQTAVEQMNSIQQTFDGLSNIVRELGSRSNEIGKIVEVITGIAGQTNLLALNAAIEAARAGEHGRGFAVVADEVRNLAEQSATSADQITKLIALIQGETNEAVQSMDTASVEVSSGIGIVHRAGQSFAQIEQSIHEVTTQVQEVSAAVQQMAAGTEQVVQSIQFIRNYSEEVASGAEESSAATEEQLASMEEVSNSAGSLANMAEELQNLIRKFRV